MRRSAERATAAGNVPPTFQPGPPRAGPCVSILALQRGVGNRAVTTALTAHLSGGSMVPTELVIQRDRVRYEPNESAIATDRGILPQDVQMLAGTGSRYNAAANSIVIADFRPNSATVRTSASAELRRSWIGILEGNRKQQFALLGFSDAAGEEGQNQQLRADRARAVAALLPGTASRGVVGPAPAGDYIRPANVTREDRALNRSVLVRLPPEELRQEAQVDEYSADAVGYWRSHPASTVTDLMGYVSARANALLARNGVPEPDVVMGSAAKGTTTLAFFEAKVWTITFDVKALAASQAGVTPATTMSALSLESVAELSQAAYHEARHAEQDFLAARSAAEEASGSLSASTLAGRLEIRVDVANAAIAASAVPLPDVLRTKADAWRTFMRGGRHIPYRTWNEGLKNQLAIFKFVYNVKLHEWGKLGPGEIQAVWEHGLHPPIDKTFRRDYSFRADRLQRDLAASQHHEPVDVDVRRALTKTASNLFQMLVKEGEGRKLPDSAAVAKMSAGDAGMAKINAQLWLAELHLALLEASAAAEEAYRAYPHEADAYEVGEAATRSIRSQGAS